MFTTRFCRRSRHAALASALFLAFGASAYAHGPGFGPHGGGHGFGAHGGGPHGAHLEQIIAQVKDKLALDTSQQVLFDHALAATRSARETGRAEFQRVHDAMKAELAKPEPNLAAVAAIADEAQLKGQNLRRQVRDEWLKLYATFSPTQKQVVRDLLVQRMERFEHFGARMRERFGGQG
jgi:Spy/CpxP family protein refolding chaperone